MNKTVSFTAHRQYVEKHIIRYIYSISFRFDYNSKFLIVLFVRQHFSGSLFYSIKLLLLTRETTKGTRVRDLSSP